MRFFLLLALTASVASAQPSTWDLPIEGSAFWLSALEVSYNTDTLTFGAPYDLDDEIKGIASAFGGVINLGRIDVLTEIPFAIVNVTPTPVGDFPVFVERGTGAIVGNVQIGVATQIIPDLGIGVAIRLPTASNPEGTVSGGASRYGLTADYERLGAFLPEMVTVSASAKATREVSSSLSVHAQIAPHILIPTNKEGRETSSFASYALQGLYTTGKIRAGLNASGVSQFNSPQQWGDTPIFSLGAVADIEVGALRPGVHVRVPLIPEVLENVVDAVFGFRLAYVVR